MLIKYFLESLLQDLAQKLAENIFISSEYTLMDGKRT